MLIVLAHNDGSGTDTAANYDVEVRVNDDTIWAGRIEGHNRGEGWQELLRQIAARACPTCGGSGRVFLNLVADLIPCVDCSRGLRS